MPSRKTVHVVAAAALLTLLVTVGSTVLPSRVPSVGAFLPSRVPPSATRPLVSSPAQANAPRSPSASQALPVSRVLPGAPNVTDWRDFAPPSIAISVHADLPISFAVDRIQTTDSSTTWIGKSALRGATMVAVGSATRWDAIVSLPGSTFEIHVRDGEAVIVEKAPGVNCAPSVIVPPAKASGPRLAALINGLTSVGSTDALAETTTPALRTAAQTVRTVDVVFFYTADAEAAAVKTAGSLSLVTDFMASTYRAYIAANNVILENSNVANLRWRFRGAFRLPDYPLVVVDHNGDNGAERYDIYNDLRVISNHGTPAGDFVAAKCAELAADQCVLIMGDHRQAAGVGESPGTRCVVGLGGTNLTLAHEMGHNLGLSHDRATDKIPDNDGSFAHGFAFQYPRFDGDLTGTTWRPVAGDVMAYAASLPYYANPDVQVTGSSFAYGFGWILTADNNLYRIGVAADEPKAANAARAIREYATVISAVASPTGQSFPSFTLNPTSANLPAGSSPVLTATVAGNDVSLSWFKDGIELPKASTGTINLPPLSAQDVGLYDVVAVNGAGSTVSDAAVVGMASTAKVAGAARVVGMNIVHPNGNVYDQILLTGNAATITADPKKVTRISFVDLSDDIVQVEFSGAGSLSVALTDASGPAAPSRYNQPDVQYMKGRAAVVISGADETTNVSVFTVGRATALNQALFRDDVAYDGIANIAYIAISSPSGRFGGVHTANVVYSAERGYAGIYARGVRFDGPLFIGNIVATSTASPVLVFDAVTDARITGGDLWQQNSQPIRITGLTALQFTAGTDSHNHTIAAQPLRARFERDGLDVTSSIKL